MNKYKPKSKQWFIKRIGKRIYRDVHPKHCCKDCDDVAKNGIIINGEIHAMYLADIDAEFANCGVYSNYRDEK